MEKTINIYDAIAQMRKLSKIKEDFSMAFMSHDKSREISRGLIEVPRARLRSSTPEDDNQYSDFMLNYTNLDTMMPGQFWKPCLMYFNGQKIEL